MTRKLLPWVLVLALVLAVAGWVILVRLRQHGSATSAVGSPATSAATVAAPPGATTRGHMPAPGIASHPKLPPSDPRLRVLAATDLYPLDVELRARAERGDADAVVALDDIQAECLLYFLGHGDEDQAHFAEKLHPGATPRMEVLLGRQRARCGHFTHGDLVPRARMEALLRAAAAQGDIAAKARLLMMYDDLDKMPDAELVANIRQIAASRDPLAWNDLASVMSMRVESRSDLFGLPAGTEETSQAWTAAACALGMDCGPDGRILAFLCRTQALCSYGSVDAMIRDVELSPMEYRRMQGDVQRILDLTQPHP